MNKGTYYISASEISQAITQYDHSLEQSALNQHDVRVKIDEFMQSSTSVLTGEVWDSIRNNYESYINIAEYHYYVNDVINKTNKESLRKILDFLDTDESLNTADLPRFEAERDRLNKEIQTARDRIESLKTVPAKISKEVTETGPDGKPYTYTKEVDNEPAYSDAQNEIANIYHQIDSKLQPALDETNRLINKINEFNNKIMPDIMRIYDSVDEVLNQFAKKVEEQQTSDNSKSGDWVNMLAGIIRPLEAVGGDTLTWAILGAASPILPLFGANDEDVALYEKTLANVIGQDALNDSFNLNPNKDSATYIVADKLSTAGLELLASMFPGAHIVFGAAKGIGDMISDLYANNPDVQGGILADNIKDTSLILASAGNGALSAYFTVDGINELGEILVSNPSLPISQKLYEYIINNKVDVFGEMGLDAFNNILETYKETGSITSSDVFNAGISSVFEATLSFAGGANSAKAVGAAIDIAQGFGADTAVESTGGFIISDVKSVISNIINTFK